MRRAPFLFMLLAGLMVLPLAACTPPSQEGTATVALSGTDLDGEKWDIDDLEGSVVVVAVWASWCGPCRAEVPTLSRAQERYGGEGLLVLGVNFKDSADAARRFVEAEKASYPSVVDQNGTIAVSWGVRGIPESFLVDRDGEVVDRHIGPVTEEWIEEVVVPEVRR